MEEKKENTRKEPNFMARLKGKKITIILTCSWNLSGVTLEMYNRFEILIRDHDGKPRILMKHCIAEIIPEMEEGEPDPFARKEDQNRGGSE